MLLVRYADKRIANVMKVYIEHASWINTIP